AASPEYTSVTVCPAASPAAETSGGAGTIPEPGIRPAWTSNVATTRPSTASATVPAGRGPSDDVAGTIVTTPPAAPGAGGVAAGWRVRSPARGGRRGAEGGGEPIARGAIRAGSVDACDRRRAPPGAGSGGGSAASALSDDAASCSRIRANSAPREGPAAGVE